MNVKRVVVNNTSKMTDLFLEIRNQPTKDYVDHKFTLNNPFTFINDYDSDQYWVKRIQHTIGSDKEELDGGTFPVSINEFFWTREKENNWYCLCRLHSGIFAYYEASCSSKGFKDRGFMNIVLCKDYATLIKEALNYKVYDLYIGDTLCL